MEPAPDFRAGSYFLGGESSGFAFNDRLYTLCLTWKPSFVPDHFVLPDIK